MIPPTVNILVRVDGNEKRFNRLLKSIAVQSYAYIRVIMAYDLNKDISYIPEFIEVVHSGENAWNSLKAQATDGWFFFMDEEDYLLHRHVIANTINDLFSPRLYICQTLDNNLRSQVKPSWIQPFHLRFQKTKIALPCVWAHYSHRDLVNFDTSEWEWICQMKNLVGYKFLQQLNVCQGSTVNIPVSQVDEYLFKDKFKFETLKNKKRL